MLFAATPQPLVIPNATAGETFSAGVPVYKDVFNQRGNGASRWYKIDITATGPVKISPVIGISKTAGTSGSSFLVQTGGLVRGLSGLTADAPVWASTAGNLTQSHPSVPSSGSQAAIALLGVAVGTTSLLLAPEPVTFCKFQSSLAVGGTVTVEHWPDSGARTRRPSSYLVNTIDPTCVGYWKFDEGTTGATVLDESFSGNNGTPVNSPTYTSGVPSAMQFSDPYAITFNASNQNVTIANSASLSINGNLTIAAWVKTTQTTQFGYIFCGSNTSSPFNGYGFAINATTTGGIGYWDGSNTSWASSPNANVNDGNWHHVAVTVSGTTATLYVDGVSKSTATVNVASAFSGNRSIGNRPDGNFPFTGSIDDLRIYNRALSLSEIQAAAGGGAMAFYDAPIALGNNGMNAGATNLMLVQFSDPSAANPATYTTFTNQTNGTRNIACEVAF